MASKKQKEIKDLGRKVHNFDGTVWDKNKISIVLDGNLAKFSQNEKLKSMLLSTGDKILVEASPYDKIWGIGRSVRDGVNLKIPTNWLGFMMVVTAEKRVLQMKQVFVLLQRQNVIICA